MRSLAILAIVCIPTSALAQREVQVANGQRIRWEPGMVAVLRSECSDSVRSPQRYRTGADGSTPCYRTPQDAVGSDWLWNGAPITVLTPSSGCEERFEVPGGGRLEWVVTRVRGYMYHSPNPLQCEYEGRYVETAIERYSAEFYEVTESCRDFVTVTALEGRATERGNALRQGQTIGNRTRISTGPDSSVELSFDDGSVARLGPNSRLSVTCEEMAELRRKLSFSRMLGRLWWTITDDSIDHTVGTTYCGVAARGTAFEVWATPRETRVLVGEGHVHVEARAGGRTLDLGRCEAASATSRSNLRQIPPYPSPNVEGCPAPPPAGPLAPAVGRGR